MYQQQQYQIPNQQQTGYNYHPHHHHHHLNQQQQFNDMPQQLDSNAPEFSLEEEQVAESQTQEEMHALNALREVMRQLSDKPGMFEEYSMELKEAYGEKGFI